MTPLRPLAFALLLIAACAPIVPLPAPAGPLPETPAESPAPVGVPTADLDADAVTARLRTAGLTMPVRGAAVERLEDSFDAPRDGGRRHDAVDILAPRGTPVLAAFDGTVRRVGTNALGGNVVWITDPSNAFAFYYAHLDRHARDLREGMTVTRGTVLGTVGTTGNAPPDVPHLHFQVLRVIDPARWSNGTPLNPLPFLVGGATTARGGTREMR